MVLDCCRELLEGFSDTAVLDAKIEEAAESCEMLREMSEKFIRDNATKAMDQKAFQKKYDSYADVFDRLNFDSTRKFDELMDRISQE